MRLQWCVEWFLCWFMLLLAGWMATKGEKGGEREDTRQIVISSRSKTKRFSSLFFLFFLEIQDDIVIKSVAFVKEHS